MKLLTNKQQEFYENKKYAMFAKKSLKISKLKIKDIMKLEIIVVI